MSTPDNQETQHRTHIRLTANGLGNPGVRLSPPDMALAEAILKQTR